MEKVEELPDAASTDLWIFRDGRRTISGPEMLRSLSERIADLRTNPAALLAALIQAGELEAALSDAASPGAAASAKLTDTLAFALCTGTLEVGPSAQFIKSISTPEQLSTSPPEGFTYYALHPLDFARVVSRVPDSPKACAIIGIRSIGTTLSAVAAAALKTQDRPVSRITVRPEGHPYSRVAQFTAQETEWIQKQLSLPAQFLIVDEGPGRSGSTFLAVSEALLRAGVRQEMITMLGSREVDPASLCAPNAALRWNAFRFLSTVPSVSSRFTDCTYIGGGEWRPVLLPQGSEFPESWTQMERLKFLSADGKTIFKFEGMGPLGADVRDRAFVIADAGFAPSASDAGDGFLAYPRLTGKALRRQDLTSALLEHIARYCAFRVATFSVRPSAPSELRQMVKFNAGQELGGGLRLQLTDGELHPRNPILADGRMQPHEWIATSDGSIFKTDAIDHGDNHFFPGPCDIAWDLAGTVIEWQLNQEAEKYLARCFREFSGIDVSPQLHAYKLAYSLFRLGFCKMAITTVIGSPEEYRMRAAYLCYRRQANWLLHSPHASPEAAA